MPPQTAPADTASQILEPHAPAPLAPYVAPMPAAASPRPVALSLTEAMMSVPPMLAGALVDAQAAVGRVAKDSRNEFHCYNYAAGDDMIDEGRLALTSAGLALMSSWKLDTSGAIDRAQEGKHGIKVISVIGRVVVSYTLIHRSGEAMRWVTSTAIIPEAGRPDDKAECGALTTNLGYSMRHLLCMSRGEEERVAAPEAAARNDRGQPAGTGFAAPDANDRASAYQGALDKAKSLADVETVETAILREGHVKLKVDALRWAGEARARVSS